MIRWRSIAGLAALLAVLLGLAWWVSRQPATTATPTPPPRVIPLDFEDVQRVDIERDGVSIALQRSGTEWEILGPSVSPADRDEVERRLRSFMTMVSFDVFTPENLEEFGLLSPTARVSIQAHTGTVVLLVGDRTPTENDYYVQREGDPTVYVVSRYLVDRVLEWVEQPPYPPTPTPSPVPESG